MVKHITYIALISVAVAAFCSCGRESYAEAQAVMVASCVDGNATKAPYSLAEPSLAKPLAAAVWVSTTSASYPGSQVGANDENALTLDYHNSATFTSSSKQLLSTQIYYPYDRRNVYVVGLYPQAGWNTVNSGGGAEYTFDGSQDVMFAYEAHNSLETSANFPTLRFHHLLTWLKFNISAETQETADVWGNIQSISIKSKNNVQVGFSDNSVVFSEPAPGNSMWLKLTADDSNITGKDIQHPTTPTYMAYVLCAPVEATSSAEEYVLTVNTRNRQNVQVKLNLKSSSGADYTGNTAGHQFTVSLKFVQGENILTSAVVSEWSNGGSTMINIDE